MTLYTTPVTPSIPELYTGDRTARKLLEPQNNNHYHNLPTISPKNGIRKPTSNRHFNEANTRGRGTLKLKLKSPPSTTIFASQTTHPSRTTHSTTLQSQRSTCQSPTPRPKTKAPSQFATSVPPTVGSGALLHSRAVLPQWTTPSLMRV